MIGVPPKVFISYSHADQEWLERLKRHLKPLVREGRLDCWDDTHIQPGDDWQQDIRNALDMAQVAVLLISANFFASDFIDENELPPLLIAAKAKGVRILPVILSASRFARHPALAHFQAVNSPDRPLATVLLAEQEEVFDHLAQTIESALLTFDTISNKLTSVQCPMCGLSDVDRIESVSIESFDAVSAGWAIGGNVSIRYCAHSKCCNCGNVFDDIQHAIPVQYPSLRCPECDEPEFLRCRVRQLKKTSQYFTFQAILCCTHCGLANSAQKELSELSSLEAIIVSGRGVSLTTQPSKHTGLKRIASIARSFGRRLVTPKVMFPDCM
jgi:TIR domain-containing protein